MKMDILKISGNSDGLYSMPDGPYSMPDGPEAVPLSKGGNIKLYMTIFNH